jgi:hypothetical protein
MITFNLSINGLINSRNEFDMRQDYNALRNDADGNLSFDGSERVITKSAVTDRPDAMGGAV